MPFNNAIRRLIILSQGSDGKVLLRLLDRIEAFGSIKFINESLHKMVVNDLKVAEFDTVITVALLNWTTGVANSQIKYGVCNGLDAWRKVYIRYVPLADDLQNILIQNLMAIKQVGDADVDTFFNEIDRITELYAKIEPSYDLSDKRIPAAITRNLPERITTNFAMDIRKATTIEEMQSVVNVYLHDNRIGLPKGMPGTTICMTAKEEEDISEEHKTCFGFTCRPYGFCPLMLCSYRDAICQ